MSLVLAAISPHPPIIIPEIGRGSAAQVKSTVDAMRELGSRVRETEYETLVIVSPHSPCVADAFLVRGAARFDGNLAMFGAPQVAYSLDNDSELSEAIAFEAGEMGLPVVGSGGDSGPAPVGGNILDHGMLVPLYFIRPPEDRRVVSLGVSYLEFEAHYDFGKAIRRAVEASKTSCVFVASGDLSHRLTAEAPAGYSPRGQEFDLELRERLEKCELSGMADWDEGLVYAAGECGLRSIIMTAGMFADRSARCRVYSYEGPFGVGYLVATVQDEGKGEKRAR